LARASNESESTMLDKMRAHSRNFIIYIFFGIIIAVFVVNFGPQSQGCVAGTSHAGSVNGKQVTLNEVHYVFVVARQWAQIMSRQIGRALTEQMEANLKARALDAFLRRQLLAAAARDRGLEVGDDEIHDMLLKDRYLALGMPTRLWTKDDNNVFDYKYFSKWVRYHWGINAKKFINHQRQELLAEKLQTAIKTAVKVSRAEVKADYVHRNTRAQLQYVRFSPATFRAKVPVTKAKVAAFIKKNEDRIKKYYNTNKATFTKKRKPEVLISLIRVDFDKAGDQAKAVAKANEIAAKLKKGESFEALAKDSHHKSATSEGLVGWRDAKKPGFGKAGNEAISKLAKKGDTSEVVIDEKKKTATIYRLDAKRDGSVSLDNAKEEIARDLIRDDESKLAARNAADGYIKQIKKGKKLSELFKKDADAGELKLQETPAFPRSPYDLVPGIGVSGEVMKAAFTLKKDQVADVAFTVNRMIYLVALKDRKEADMKSWEKDKHMLSERFQAQRADAVVTDFVYNACRKALKENRIQLAINLTSDPSKRTQKTKKGQPQYVPCRTLKPSPLGGGFGRGGFGGGPIRLGL
jgi:hypothetical protein